MTGDTAAEAPPGEACPGRGELGTISISSRVVQKLAARAAVEVPDAGAAAPRVMGRSVSGAGAIGGRQTSLTGLPRSSAQVDGSTAVLDLSISIRWRASVPAVSSAVREHVRDRVTALTGLNVTDVSISVTDLATGLEGSPRVS
ncbi:MAG: Asp23/Gls24 family envelope stress response protein [Streptosporangiaceae bacterium]